MKPEASPGNDEREAATDAREEIARLERELVVAREQAAEATDVRQLAKEANEKLIVAMVRLQELTEAAERAKALADDAARKLQEREAHLRVVAEFRERMLGEVGHDLHSPLVSISVAVTVLLREGASESQTGVLNGILTSCNRMLDMVSELLDLTQARLGGGITIRPALIDLAALTWSVVEEMETANEGRRIHLDAPSCVEGQWDSGRMGRVISNLIGNAMQHGDADFPVKVGLHLEDTAAILTVENQGPRIAPEVVATMFQPFRRGPRSAARSKGLGLGLFISEQTVQAHGGRIEVESSVAGTTVFRVRLPRFAAVTDETPHH